MMDNIPINNNYSQISHSNPHPINTTTLSTIEEKEFTSIYSKLNLLCNEIEGNILELNNSSEEIVQRIKWLKNESYKDNLPEINYITRLFRKYVEDVNILKMRSSLPSSSTSVSTNDHPRVKNDEKDEFLPIPSYIYEGTADQIIGYDALKKNVFWSRVSTGIFSFISFVIMSFVPFIHRKKVSPHMLFNSDCEYKNDPEYKVGAFNFVPYQYIIGLGVFCFLYSIFFAIYYLLPVDTNSRKYIPGMRNIFQLFLSPADINAYHHQISDAIKQSAKSIEPIVDGGLFLMVLIAAIRAAAVVESPQPFGSDVLPFQTYYSLNSFTATFENTHPMCIDDGVVRKIRASISMIFLSVLCMGFTFQVSLRSYFKEQKQKQIENGIRSLPLPMKSPVDHEDSVRL